MIIMLSSLYDSIFRTAAYLMSEAYSKPCQISKIIRHNENPGIVRTVYSGISYIFRDNQQYSVMFRLIFKHVRAYTEGSYYILRHIQAGII